MVMRNVIVAHPAGWSNPVVPRHPDEYTLMLARESRAGTGLQLNPAARARKSPIDPIARPGASDRIDPGGRVIELRRTPAATVASPAAAASAAESTRIRPGAAVELNPQPLPPRTNTVNSALKSRTQPDAGAQVAPAARLGR
jgi:hypothetical protein